MWKKVDVEGKTYSLTRGDRAGRVEFDGSTFRAKVGRRRGAPPRLYWTWEDAGEHADLQDAQRAAESRLPG